MRFPSLPLPSYGTLARGWPLCGREEGMAIRRKQWGKTGCLEIPNSKTKLKRQSSRLLVKADSH